MNDAKTVLSRRFYGWDGDWGVLRCNVCDAVPSHPSYPHADFCPLPALEQAESALAASQARVEALDSAKTLAFQIQQAAMAAYAESAGNGTVDLSWVINMTTRLLELMQ